MLNKYLESMVEVDLLGESDNRICLEYYLVESEPDQRDESFGDKVYGIEIVKKEDERHAESEIVQNLSNNKENTKGILNMLARNTVTPVGLAFVLEDYIAL